MANRKAAAVPPPAYAQSLGWMLQELGKKDEAVGIVFLDQHYQQMPRTMLHYAIECLPGDGQQGYMKGTS